MSLTPCRLNPHRTTAIKLLISYIVCVVGIVVCWSAKLPYDWLSAKLFEGGAFMAFAGIMYINVENSR